MKKAIAYLILFITYILMFWGLPATVDDPSVGYLQGVFATHIAIITILGVVCLCVWAIIEITGK